MGHASATSHRFEALDGWRGLCALFVAIMHFPAASPLTQNAFFSNAWLFVDYFFVLSGFVIANGYLRTINSGTSYLQFAVKRFGRIYPLHVAVLAAFVAWEALRAFVPALAGSGAEPFTDGNSMSALVSNLLLLNGTGLHSMLTWNGPSWSLSAEFWTYLAFGGLLLVYRRHIWMALLPLVVLAPVVLYLYSPHAMDTTYDFGLLRCFYGFAVGALLNMAALPSINAARTQRASDQGTGIRISWTLAELATVLAVAVYVSMHGRTELAFLAPAVFAFCVYVFAHEGGLVSLLLRSRPFAVLGTLSYAIYMVHIFVQSRMINAGTLFGRMTGEDVVGPFTARGSEFYGFGLNGPLFATLMVVAMIVLVVITAWIVNRLVEKPFQRWSRRAADHLGDARRLKLAFRRNPVVASRAVAAPDDGILAPVQYLRIAAAMAVFLYHISATVHSTWAEVVLSVDAVGAAGVDLFFVVSGFIMAKIVADTPRLDIWSFLRRRILRVLPLYWLVTLFVFALALALPGLFNSVPGDWGRLLHSLAFIPYAEGGESQPPVVLVGWTLNYEMFFYLLVALGAGLLADRGLVLVRLAIMGLVIAGLLLQPVSPVAGFYTDPILLEFLFGITVFQLWDRSDGPSRNLVYPAMLVAGVLALVFQFEHDPGATRVFYWGVPSAMILLGALHSIRFRSQRLIEMADWSYALYLTHVFVVMAFIKFIIPTLGPLELRWQVHYIAMTAAAVVLAALTHMLVEKPASAILRRLLPERMFAGQGNAARTAHSARRMRT